MPLRDHFHPPLSQRKPWEGLHGQWPAMIVLDLFTRLPPGYEANPSLSVGKGFEVDVGTQEEDDPVSPTGGAGGGGVALWAPPRPNVVVEADLSGLSDYEVRVYDMEAGRTLVAAIEIVSPANKDRPAHREEFVGKCVSLLRQKVSVTIVDLVTSHHFNLYADLLGLFDESDPAFSPVASPIYAVTCRWVKRDRKRVGVLEAWSQPLLVGQPLPTLPLWLGPKLAIPLELERSYEETCRVLHVR